MRCLVGIARIACVAVLAIVVAPSTASAQGFFQQLFGWGTPAPAPATGPTAPAPMLTPGGRPYPLPYSPFVPRKSDDDDRASRTGNYKTVCVRMCDGYFFPVSNATAKKGFHRDQMKCRASCGEDARLFHLPAGATDIGEATDGQGRTYALLNVAFRYKKTVTPGCQCRPAPWTETEAARHQQYAEVEADKVAAEKSLNAKIAAADKTIGEKAAAAVVKAEAPTTETASGEKPAKIAANTKPTNTKSSTTSRRASTAPQVAQKPPGAMGLGASGAIAWPGDAPARR